LPPLAETLKPCAWDEVVIDELWSFVFSKAQQAWVWIALSRRHLQIVAFHVGKRDLESARALWEQVPSPWRDGLVFTDGLATYAALFAQTPLKHCRCPKGDPESFGETSVVEGANNALRQGVSYLGRKTLSFARSTYWLCVRLRWFIHHWNLRQAKKWD
jgi:insertion element IS1 protein InsB